jgi:DhnA family fructose-bisphosphate aldolase class Ia
VDHTKRRMRRIFQPDGRTFIVAMDHAGYMSSFLPPLTPIASMVAECSNNGADAFLINYGMARHLGGSLGNAALIMTMSTNLSPAMERGVEQALTIGADAIKVLTYPFESTPEPSMLSLGWLGAECGRWGMPLLAETIPGGWGGGPGMRTAEAVAAGARVAAAAGADFVKTFMVDEPEAFQQVTTETPVPVVILGGANTGNTEGLLRTVRSALDQGASGVAMGRNIWGADNPGRMVAAVAAVIHHDATVEDAMGIANS